MATIVGLFDSAAQAQDAVQRLRSIGVPDGDISVAAQSAEGTISDTAQDSSASGAARGAVAGGLLGGIAGLFIGLGAVTIPGIGIVAVGGPLAAALLGAGVGVATGGLVGALVDAGVPEEDARAYETGVKEGKVLVTALVPDEQASAAQEEMNRASATSSGAGATGTQADTVLAQDEGHLHADATAAAMAGPGIIGSGAIGGPAGLTARAAAIGSAKEVIEEERGEDIGEDDGEKVE